MNLRRVSVFLMGLIMSIGAIAGEEHRKHVEIVIDGDHDGTGEVHFSSRLRDLDLMELQLGESRSIVDENGNNLFVVRTEDGFDFDMDGRKFSIPDPETLLDAEGLDALHQAHGEDGDRHVIRRMHRIEIQDDGETSDAADGHDEEHEVHIIRREVEVDVTN